MFVLSCHIESRGRGCTLILTFSDVQLETEVQNYIDVVFVMQVENRFYDGCCSLLNSYRNAVEFLFMI